MYTGALEQLMRLQTWVGLGTETNSSSSDKASTSSPTSPSEPANNDRDKNQKHGTGSAVVWWLTSLLFGISSTLIYQWIREEIRKQQKIKNSSSTSTSNNAVAEVADSFLQWSQRKAQSFRSLIADRSSSEITLQLALGTSLMLPDQFTVPWVVGCLVLSSTLLSFESLTQQRELSFAAEKYPPYLFLCFCPSRQRFQLWFTWMGLQLVNHRGIHQWATSFHRNKGSTTDEASVKPKSLAKSGTIQEDKTYLTSDTKDPSKLSSSRYLEVLVHNVSHTDIILGLNMPKSSKDPTSGSVENDFCLSRPRFSFMDTYCRKVLDALKQDEKIVEFPCYERSEEDSRYRIKDEPTGVVPTGLALPDDPSLMADTNEVRVRGRDLAKLDADHETAPWPLSPREKTQYPINYVFFPLLATLLPRWRTQIEERKYPRNVKRVLILVTGVGTPRNWTHSVSGNSTEVCAQVMERFLKRVDPDITVVRIHSDTNIFRYDDNLRFVDKDFAPVMNAWRDAHAKGLPYPDELTPSTAISETPFNADWRNSMSVTLSAADGSTARTHAIRESLRPFRPTFFHFWQLKTFWHETKIVDDDLEVHSFETMETVPAVDASRLRDLHVQLVVQEMKAFREEMIETLRRGQHDISKFWLRKTHKPVLAVLLVQSRGMSRPVLYRGTNMEVSMPTGSLCAERNVIGTALAANPELKREDLKLIAVLAIPTLEEMSEKPIRRVDSSASMGSTTLASNQEVIVRDRQMSIGSEQDEWVLPIEQQQQSQGLDQSFTIVQTLENNPSSQESESTPVRKIRLFSRSAGHNKHRKSVLIQNSKDLNPLAPCGACNEWLKKISESNPYFTILTFTDAECHGVYCTPCQQ